MKDAAGRVIYVGKAKNLRARAGSYFLKAAAEDPRTARLVPEIRDIDYLEAESEVDALLMEARLIKDIQPKFNRDLRDDKTFPYLEIYTREDFPRVEFTREPKSAGHEALRAVRQPAGAAGRDPGAAKDLSASAPARWTSTRTTRAGGGSGRACWPRSASVRPRATCGSRRRSTARTSAGLQQFLEGKKESLLERDARGDGSGGPRAAASRRPPGCATKSTCWKRSTSAASWKRTSSPRCFPSIRRRGWRAAKGAAPGQAAADDRGGRHCAHRRHRDRGQPGAVHRRAAVQAGLQADANPHGRRGSTTWPASARWSPGGSSGCDEEGELLPDILLIDGGKGQFNAALAAFAALEIEPPTVVSLAKREEEIYLPERRRAAAPQPPLLCPAAAAIRPRRGPPFRPALSPHPSPPHRRWASERARRFLIKPRPAVATWNAARCVVARSATNGRGFMEDKTQDPNRHNRQNRKILRQGLQRPRESLQSESVGNMPITWQ